jgi:hypothetical protein
VRDRTHAVRQRVSAASHNSMATCSASLPLSPRGTMIGCLNDPRQALLGGDREKWYPRLSRMRGKQHIRDVDYVVLQVTRCCRADRGPNGRRDRLRFGHGPRHGSAAACVTLTFSEMVAVVADRPHHLNTPASVVMVANANRAVPPLIAPPGRLSSQHGPPVTTSAEDDHNNGKGTHPVHLVRSVLRK